jgi:hypothetical protein
MSRVSGVTGRRQGRALRLVTWAVVILAAVSTIWEVPEAGWGAVGLLWATPPGRLLWLMFRWGQERDWRFVVAGAGLLVVIAVGVVLGSR